MAGSVDHRATAPEKIPEKIPEIAETMPPQSAVVTRPAPPLVTRRVPPPDEPLAARPTTIPSSGLLPPIIYDSRIPLDLGVPVRVAKASTDSMDHQTAFLLAHVDGVSTVDQIATMASLPLPVATEVFRDLLARGVITFEVRKTERKSGVFAT